MHLFEQPDFLPFLRGQEETRGAEMSLEIRFYFSFLNIKRISGIEAMDGELRISRFNEDKIDENEWINEHFFVP